MDVKQPTNKIPLLLFRPSALFVSTRTGLNFTKRSNTNNDIRTERRNSRFVTTSLLRRELSPTRTLKRQRRNSVQITCNASGADHVLYIVCCVVRRDSASIKFDRQSLNRIILSLFLGLKRLTDEGGEETGVPGENPWLRASENATY